MYIRSTLMVTVPPPCRRIWWRIFTYARNNRERERERIYVRWFKYSIWDTGQNSSCYCCNSRCIALHYWGCMSSSSSSSSRGFCIFKYLLLARVYVIEYVPQWVGTRNSGESITNCMCTNSIGWIAVTEKAVGCLYVWWSLWKFLYSQGVWYILWCQYVR